MSRIDCILYPPTLDYNYLVQRPQQLIKNFSELGIPSLFLNVPSPNFDQAKGIEKPNDKLYIFNHVDPQPYLRDIRPVVYFSAAWHIDMVQKYNPSLLVFDSVDEPSDEFEAWKPYYFRAVSLSDIVLNTSDKLYEMSWTINPHSYLVPNGCDYSYFSRAANRDLPIPGDIAGISHPIIGYIGVIASWLDLQLVDRIAENFPHCNVVMIGPLYNVSQIPRRANLHWLDFKPYDQLAAYAQCFDVGIIPFIQSSMVESVNPIKMWEYMACGIPVVTSAIPEARKYKDYVLYSADQNGFLNNIHQALYNDSSDKRSQRMAVAEQNSWRHRAQQIVDIIEQRLENMNYQSKCDNTMVLDILATREADILSGSYAPSYTQIFGPHLRFSFSNRISLRINARGYSPLESRIRGKIFSSEVKGIRVLGQAAYRYRTIRAR